MKQEIIRSEYAPGRESLWLHSKDGHLCLEAFGDSSWEPVCNVTVAEDNPSLVTDITLTNIKSDSPKKDVVSAINNINKVLTTLGFAK